MKNIQRKENFDQVCVLPGTLLPDDQVEQFTKHFADNGFRVHHLETLKTAPDLDEEGRTVKGTGGRSDIFFAIHNDDIMKFAIPRLSMGIKWIEDVLDNKSRGSLYPDRVKKYRSW